MGGDGLTGAVAGELRDGAGVLAVLPGGRGNDFARKLGIPADPVAACALIAAGAERRIDVARGRRPRATSASSAPGFDSDVQGSPTRRGCRSGTVVYVYGDAARAGALEARPAGRSTVDGEPREFDGYSVAVANSGVFGGGMYLVPDAALDDGLLDVVLTERLAQAPLPARACRRSSRARTCDEPGLHILRGREVTFHADRPFTAYADGDPIADLPATVARRSRRAARAGADDAARRRSCWPPARSAALARRAGRGGGTSLPGKVLTRVEPHAIGLLAGAAGRAARVVISATNGKTTTAAMVAVDPRAHRRAARAQPRRGEHGRRRRQRAGRRRAPRRARARRRPRPVRGRRVLARPGGRGARAARAAARATCSATSSTATASSRRSPTAGPSVVAARPTARARAQRRRPAGRRPRARRATPLYFGVEDDALALPELQHASDSKHCRRCGHAYVYEAVYLAHLGRYHCPNCGSAPARARRSRPATSSCAASAAPRSRCARRAASARVELPAPRPLQRLQRARRRGAVPARSASPLDDVAAGLARRRARVRPRRDDRPRRPPDLDPAGQEPGRRQRGAAHARARGRELDLFGVLNDRTADGRDVSWVWDADWEVLAPHVRRMTCSGTRAAELALRMKYAGVDPARLHVVEGLEAGARRARCAEPATGPLYALPTYTALLELRELLAQRGGQAEGVLAMTADVRRHVVSGTTSSAAATTPTCRCGASWRREAGGPVLDVGAGTGRVALDLAARRPRRHRARPRRASCSPRWRGARGGRASTSTTVRRRRRAASTSPTPLRADRGADADDPAAPRRGGARGFFAAAAPRARAGRARGRGDRRRARGASTSARALPLPDVGEARRLALRLPAGRGARRAGARCGSSACARSSRPTARARARTTRSSSRTSPPRASPPRPARAGLRARAAARGARRPTSTSAPTVVLLRG